VAGVKVETPTGVAWMEFRQFKLTQDCINNTFPSKTGSSTKEPFLQTKPQPLVPLFSPNTHH